ncbi:MAG: hypothetical protein CMP81_23855 [Fulvimarina sp.]|nr:hypothetical protein [Fulvimarina sp.]
MSFVSLDEVAEVFNGKTPAKSDQRETGHPVLKIRDVDDAGQFRGAFGSFVDHELAAQHKKKQVAPGDTLILNAAHNASYVGSKSFFATEGVRGALATGEWLLVRPDYRRLHAGFAHYWLTSVAARSAIRDQVKGIHLYPKDVARLSLPLPPLDEQRRIAAILDKADALRRKRKRALDLLDSLTQSIFLEMFGDPKLNSKNWSKMALEDVGKVSTGKTPPTDDPSNFGSEVPFMTPGDLAMGRRAGRALSELGAEKSKVVQEGAALVCCIGATIGKMDIAKERCSFNQQINAVQWSNKVTPQFGLHALRFVKHQIIERALSTTLPILKKSEFQKITIIVPPIDHQLEFDKQTTVVHAQFEIATNYYNESCTLFASLQSRAFSGQL